MILYQSKLRFAGMTQLCATLLGVLESIRVPTIHLTLGVAIKTMNNMCLLLVCGSLLFSHSTNHKQIFFTVYKYIYIYYMHLNCKDI